MTCQEGVAGLTMHRVAKQEKQSRAFDFQPGEVNRGRGRCSYKQGGHVHGGPWGPGPFCQEDMEPIWQARWRVRFGQMSFEALSVGMSTFF